MTAGEKKQKSNGKKKAPAEKPGQAPRWTLVLMSKFRYKIAFYREPLQNSGILNGALNGFF